MTVLNQGLFEKVVRLGRMSGYASNSVSWRRNTYSQRLIKLILKPSRGLMICRRQKRVS